MIIEGLVGFLWAIVGLWALTIPFRIARSVLRSILGAK
jgi:hypothetical protein